MTREDAYAAQERDCESHENVTFHDTGAIHRASDNNGFVVRHVYPNIALAIEPIAWHVTGAEIMCIPVAGIQFVYNEDETVVANIYCASGMPLSAAEWNYLSFPPRNAAFAMAECIVSEWRSIAALAATLHWPRFAHVGHLVRATLEAKAEWVLPDLVQPCDPSAARRQVKAGEARALAVRWMRYLRRGFRNGGDA